MNMNPFRRNTFFSLRIQSLTLKMAWSVAALLLAGLPSAFAGEAVQWLNWDAAVFARAQKEHKLVLLDLEAVWCHWCHVMDQSTYANPLVAGEIEKHFLPVRVDQDSRPDLSNRFRDYGWPATIIFNADGKPLVKRAGYIEPSEMNALLRKISAAPRAEAEGDGESSFDAVALPTGTFTLSPELRKTLKEEHVSLYDHRYEGWGAGGHKFLDADSVEYALLQARNSDPTSAAMARNTLDQLRNLIDPVWGGVYQYSTDGVWTHPHTEKIMAMQADGLRIYSLAYAQWGRPSDRAAAEKIKGYLVNFLKSPEGAFYVSQDADVVPGRHSAAYFRLGDAGRRKQGVPKVDRHVYARENGWAITALTAFYDATGDQAALDSARKAADWIVQHRALPDGGFTHDAKEDGPNAGESRLKALYLGDSLAMGQAFLSLYASTADRQWLTQARRTADFIDQYFRADGNPANEAASEATGAVASAAAGSFGPSDQAEPMTAARPASQPGYWTAINTGVPYTDRNENLKLARWSNLLSHVTGEVRYRQMAERAMRFAVRPDIAGDGFPAAPLIADAELAKPPLHLTVVGGKADAVAAALYREALRYPARYKRVEWRDNREAPLPNADVAYPVTPYAAAYICTNRRCSLPITEAGTLRARVDQLTRAALRRSTALK